MKYGFILAMLLLSGCNTASGNNVSDQQEETASIYKHIDAANGQDFIIAHPDAIILDVRTAKEYKEAHIKNAINIDYHASDFRRMLNKLDKGKHYIIHCKSGFRSGKSLDIMKRLGFVHITHIDDGFDAWQAAGLPIVSD